MYVYIYICMYIYIRGSRIYKGVATGVGDARGVSGEKERQVGRGGRVRRVAC